MSELHRWTQSDGEWACAAYDHGPFCRLCQHITDNTERALLDHVDAGNMTVAAEADGSFRFSLTEQGKRAAREVIERIGGDPDDESSTFDALRRDIASRN